MTKRTKQKGTRIRRVISVLVSVMVLMLLGVFWINMAAAMAGDGKLYDDAGQVPGGRVGLVFGCDDLIDGRENRYFRYRIDAAAELWKAGKLTSVIVSGDNRHHTYNEPRRMAAALIEAGVPEDAIIQDQAGLRTLDSVVRAKEVFRVKKVTFITQRFQNERAAYLARANDFDFVGFNARDVEGQAGAKTKVREIGARVKMWLDVWILRTRPVHPEGDGSEKLPI